MSSLALVVLLALTACRTAEVRDACDADPEACLTCADADDCGFAGNACTSVVYCGHVDASIAVVQIGCDAAIEYAWPDDADCACVDATCQYTP